MSVIVTGGAGFIGSNLVDALVARGDRREAVTVIDDLSTGRRDNLEGALGAGVRLVEADVRDAAAVEAAFARARPSTVFHLAAQIDVRRSVEDPVADARVNIEGTLNVLEASRRSGVRRFVNTSTGGAVYGEGRAIPAPEDHPVAPLAGYGQSKFAAEGYCALYGRLHGLSALSLRYANVYGPRQDPLGEAGVIAIFCSRLLEGGRPTIYGDGAQTRDFVFVGDVVEANLRAAESAVEGELNIGCGVETSVLELTELLADIGGRSFTPDFAAERQGEVRRIALDASRARELIGWSPGTELRRGLELTLATLGPAATSR